MGPPGRWRSAERGAERSRAVDATPILTHDAAAGRTHPVVVGWAIVAKDAFGAGSEPARISLPERTRGPLRAIVIRIFVALACIVVTATVVYVERAGYRDLDGMLDSWLDALYYATVTLSTTGYGDITP